MSQPGNTELPEYLQRKIAGLCTRCGEPAADGAQLCQAHIDDQRARTKRSNAKRRATFRRKKRCADCGAKTKRYRCPRCYKRIKGSANKHSKSEHKQHDNWRPDPGTDWNRYRGRARRGRLTREEQIDEDIRDARFAIKELQAFVEKAAQLKRPDLINLPTIQREAARREVGQHLGFAGRIVDELADKYG